MEKPTNELLMYFDIETISEYKHFTELPKKKLLLFKQYFSKFEAMLKKDVNKEVLTGEDYIQEVYTSTAAFVPEFGKICTISIGIFKDGEPKLLSFSGKDEKEILIKTNEVFNKANNKYFLCGHNIKQFDIPYIVKRSYINGIKPSVIFPSNDTKPWEVQVVDTKELWNTLNRQGWGSLDLIAEVLNLDSSKEGEVTGGSVGEFYYNDKIDLITEYCERDVLVTMSIVKRLEEIQNN